MANLEAGVSAFFAEDHRHCDEIWAEVEGAGDDAGKLSVSFGRFHAAMERHLRMEEEVLFPAFEAATGMRGMGPTEVMRHEHRQMRALLSDMASAVTEGRRDALLDLGDTLMMVIQQHNVKEEGMLYPMSDAHLSAEWPALTAKLRTYLS